MSKKQHTPEVDFIQQTHFFVNKSDNVYCIAETQQQLQ
jgi:hypothetical protein